MKNQMKMWRWNAKNFKSIFYKNACNYNNRTTARVAKHDTSRLQLSGPLFCDWKRSFGQKNGIGSCGQFSEDWQKRENPKTEKRYCSNDFLNDFFGALRLSGIFAISWYLLQPFSHRKIFYTPTSPEKCTFKILSQYTCNEYLKFVNYFKNPINIFNYILPEVKATKSKLRHNKEQNDSANETEIDQSKFDDLQKAHHRVLGTLSNFRGAECMTQKRYSEAINYFEEGARVDNPAAIFNLGICHEMGLGTSQSFKKAGEMYKRASDLGHPAAMYNLAVFYIHGYGDLETDINKAKKLFEMAASLGQLNAKKALSLENDEKIISDNVLKPSSIKSFGTDKSKEYSKFKETCIKSKELGKLNLIYEILSNKITETDMPGKKSLDDSGALDLSPEKDVIILKG